MKSRNLAEYLFLILFECIFAVLGIQAILIHDAPRFNFVVIAMIIAVLPVVYEKIKGISLPFGVKILVPFALFLHLAGGIMRWYWIYQPWYDKVAHFVSAFAIALLVFSFFLLLDSYGLRLNLGQVIWGIFIITMFLGGVWEIGERTLDIMLRSSYNNGVIDTIGDVIGNFFGTLIGMFVAYRYLKKIPSGQTMQYLLKK